MINFEIIKDVTNTSGYKSNSLPKDSTDRLLIDLYDSCDLIGWVDVLKTRFGYWETHSSLDENYWGLGLGVALYDQAIYESHKRNINICSSTNFSQHAERVWRSRQLNHRWNIKKRYNRFVVLGKK